ncbi:unnamed protein product [Lampetra planeri]
MRLQDALLELPLWYYWVFVFLPVFLLLVLLIAVLDGKLKREGDLLQLKPTYAELLQWEMGVPLKKTA